MKEKEIERCNFFGLIYMLICILFSIADGVLGVQTYVGLGFLFMGLFFRTLGAIFKKEIEVDE